ncbi:MAG: hypothetical protein ACRD0C_00060 [Acidimicrobiia bacterium]
MSDPLGRRALFSPPPEATAAPPKANGKEALYSTATGSRSLTSVVVECSGCGGRTRLNLVEFAWRHLPFWLWLPWMRYSNLMVCPACDRRTWLGVSWS